MVYRARQYFWLNCDGVQHLSFRSTRVLFRFLWGACSPMFSFIDHCLSFCLFPFIHCIVCPSIYGFWLPLWYIQGFLFSYAFSCLHFTQECQYDVMASVVASSALDSWYYSFSGQNKYHKIDISLSTASQIGSLGFRIMCRVKWYISQ